MVQYGVQESHMNAIYTYSPHYSFKSDFNIILIHAYAPA
jgi:hypothetical protein